MLDLLKSKDDKWLCTDPDNLQYCKYLGSMKWEFREFEKFKYELFFDRTLKKNKLTDILEISGKFLKVWCEDRYWYSGIVDLRIETLDNIQECLSSFYSKEEVEEFIDSTSLNDKQIIAECIWETDFAPSYEKRP